jgi:hypothetical protein
VSAFITLTFLGAGWLTRVVIGTGLLDRQLAAARDVVSGEVRAIPFGGYFAFNLGLLTLTWSLTPYYGEPFLRTALGFLLDAVADGGGLSSVGSAASKVPSTVPPTLLQELALKFDVAGFLLFFFGTTVGCLYALRKGRATQAALTLVTAVVVMAAFTLLPPLAGVGTFLSGRWFAFLYAVMAVVTAVGLDYLRRGVPPAVLLVVLLLFVAAFPTVMVASPKGTVDSPVVDDYRPKYSFEDQELAAMETVREYGNPEADRIATDIPYAILLNEKDESKFVVMSFNNTSRPGVQADEIRNDRMLYRGYQSTDAPFFGSAYWNAAQNRSETATVIRRIDRSAACGGRGVAYSNGDVALCE